MTSIYSWKGLIEKSDERQIVIKTSSGRVRELATRLKALHPYDVPEFVVIPIIDGSHDYLAWLAESTSKQRLKPQGPSPKPRTRKAVKP